MEAEKRVKKSSKSKARKEKGLSSNGAPVEEPAADIAAVDGIKASRKSKSDKKEKKQRKEKKRKAAEAEVTEEADTQEASPPPKKKSKGSKGKVVHRAAAKICAIGDQDAAKNGKAIIKVLYEEHPEVAAMSGREVQKLREELQTTVENMPSEIKPVTAFSQLGLTPDMLHAVAGFARPSPIQAQAWPIVMSGHDIVGVASTGSGKTLAFGLPMLKHIAAQKAAGVVSGKGPFALAVAPTRELAAQIHEVLEAAGAKCDTSAVCIYGGVPKWQQKEGLKAGADIVVGTPGRLKDLVEEGVCKLRQVTFVVLDEADRMLDLGFEPDIRHLVGLTRADRQTCMFSATWPQEVQKLASEFMLEPVRVTIGSEDLCAAHTITQRVEVIDLFAREARLLKLLEQYSDKKGSKRVIVFVLYKKEAPRIERLLSQNGWRGLAIHGDIAQEKRTQAVEHFKIGKVPILIATDVAARGLDIPDVEVVINFSFPLTIEDYVHRIGRTGRAGKTGLAHTFFCAAQDKPRAGELVNVLNEAKQTVPPDLVAFGTTVKKKESKLYGAHFRDVDFTAKATKMTFDSDDD